MSNWNLIPPHLWTPQLGDEGLVSNWIQFSSDDDVFSVPSSDPAANSATISRVFCLLKAALDDKDIKESLNRDKTTACQIQFQRQAMDERENYRRGYRRMNTSGSKSCQYRGVTKCNEDRYEAFVWDNTIPEGRGRTVYIGGYSTELEAARAHDLVSMKLYGQNTTTNFPASCYGHEFSDMQNMSKQEYILAMRRRGKGYFGRDSPYRGVYRIPEARKWEAWLGQDSALPKIFLGRHYSAEDAARAYDIALIKFKGMDAITNFDLSSYDVKDILRTTKHPTVKTVPPTNQQVSNTSSSSHGYKNPYLIRSHPYASWNRNNHNSIGNYAARFLNKGKNVEQPLTQQLSNSSSSSFHGYPNPNLSQSNPYSFGGTGSGVGFGSTNDNSIGNGAMFPNKGKNIVEQPLITQQLSNSSSSYSFGGLAETGSGSGVGTNDINSFSDYGAMFPNKGANVEQSQLVGTGQYFQPQESQQNQLNVNINNEFHHNLVINQSLPQSPSLTLVHHDNQNLSLQNPLNLPYLPSDFGNKSLGGDMETLSNAVNMKSPMSHMVNESAGEANGGTGGIYQVEPTNQQVPVLEDQSSELHNYNPNNLNQNFNSSFFSNFLNICSETNTDSISQMIESLDDSDLTEMLNSSGDYSFQNPSSETNTGSQSLITGSQVALDSSQYLNNSNDSSQNPCSETNTGSQSLMTDPYVMEAEADFFADLDKQWPLVLLATDGNLAQQCGLNII